MCREKEWPTGAEWAEGAHKSAPRQLEIIVANLDSDDIRWISHIIDEVDDTPRWWSRCKRERISMLLHLWASLEWENLNHLSTTIDARELARRARCTTTMAQSYLSWLRLRGYIVDVTRWDGTAALTFCWLVREVVTWPE